MKYLVRLNEQPPAIRIEAAGPVEARRKALELLPPDWHANAVVQPEELVESGTDGRTVSIGGPR